MSGARFINPVRFRTQRANRAKGHVMVRQRIVSSTGVVAKRMHSRFTSLVTAVAYVWGGKAGVKLESGEFSRVVNGGYVIRTSIEIDGRQLTTDDLIPALNEARKRRNQKEANLRAVLARLDGKL